jgi:ADP-ribosyl-[dinitrogen reductase] hydrolase
MPPRRPAPSPTDEQRRARARGALLGLAVGEALGAATRGRALLAPSFPGLADTPRDPTAGALGPATLAVIALSHALGGGGPYSPGTAVLHHRQWLERTPEAPDVARDALTNEHLRNWPHQASHAAWIRTQKRPPDGLALARTVPLALHFASDAQVRSEAVQQDVRLTHADPRAVLAAVALQGAISAAVHTAAESHAPLFAAALADLTRGAAVLGSVDRELIPEAHDAVRQLKEDLAAAEKPDPLLYGPELHLQRSGPNARLSLRLAFWELAHAPTLGAGLLDVVNRGGEAGINGAVAGALLGARFGDSALPARWRASVMMLRGPRPAGHGAPAWDLPTLLAPYEG